MKQKIFLALVVTVAFVLNACRGEENPNPPATSTTGPGIEDSTLNGGGAKDLGTTTAADNTGVTTHGGMGTTSGTPPGQGTNLGKKESTNTTTASTARPSTTLGDSTDKRSAK